MAVDFPWRRHDLPPLVIERHAEDIADLGRRLLGRAEVEVVQDLSDRQRVMM
jgi:hypothetical protein